jgi:Rieske Fe-S protein
MNNNIMDPEQQSKRNFLKILLSGGILALIGSIVYPIFSYLKPPKQNEVEVSSIKACTKSEIEKESGKIVKFGSKPAILVQTAEGNYVAFIATCTHLDCTVQYRKDLELIWCACHNGKYDINGRNISGPPPRPLEELRVLVQGEDIFISKKT